MRHDSVTNFDGNHRTSLTVQEREREEPAPLLYAPDGTPLTHPKPAFGFQPPQQKPKTR